jgi:predicted RNA binding protein YcfA (HicA-like mRNA interferase family)
VVTGRELIKLLKKHGWQLDRISGSHHIMKKKDKTLTVPVHGNSDIPKGTLNSILKEAGLK